ncbi:hypothetical protein ACO1D4_18915 [Bacillus velezensis]|uniref:hypothetical protein n=1 Tax=Bacillus amyloliquefaciens group TaxID=1938374 RepID=UPI0005A5349F|nr:MULTISPECIES: hypothetical protein [Bacillus subtilis group]ARW39038.1 SPBc2 prophage-derived uncharacterized protein YoqE [Bacillus amyloliquefaciens]AXY38662.1 hypothetical protein D3C60_13145 [Bacillus velezensis]AYK64702.1 hypothetical protein D9C11_03615 [Bacillus subtilis subsp. subtilis]MBI0443289.1 hypothetical protein [Bacillus velezensis]MED0754134.1 hypothetical protein [Bacillus amyloliquefaciens]
MNAEKQQTRYGIYSLRSRKFCFGIDEPSKTKAWKALFNKIGKDAYKWRFEARKIRARKVDTARPQSE